MAVSKSHAILVGLISSLSAKEFNPEELVLSEPTPATSGYNTKVMVRPSLETPYYFGKWFNYNRVDFSGYDEISVFTNGAQMLSDIVGDIATAGGFSIAFETAAGMVEETLDVEDIEDTPLPPIPAGEERVIALRAKSTSYLYMGETLITLKG